MSADKLDDTRNGASYLRVRVALPPAERARLEGVGCAPACRWM